MMSFTEQELEAKLSLG